MLNRIGGVSGDAYFQFRVLELDERIGSEPLDRIGDGTHDGPVKTEGIRRLLPFLRLFLHGRDRDDADPDDRLRHRDGSDLGATPNERPQPEIGCRLLGADARYLGYLESRLAQDAMRGGQDPDVQRFPTDFAAHRFRKDALDLRPDRRRVEQLSKVERRDYQQPPQNDRAINCIAGGFDPAPPFRRSAHSRQILL